MVSFLFLLSCGSDDVLIVDQVINTPITPCAEDAQSALPEVIIDDLVWDDYLDLINERTIRNSKSTGQIRIPIINASCTAFLVSENIIMTNNHCVPSWQYADGVRLFMRDIDKSRDVFFCDTLLATSSNLDFSLLECEGKPGIKYGSIPLSTTTPSKNQNMYLIQENCNYLDNPRCMVHKYLAKGQIHRVSLNSLSHDADTLGGSSGSPIFSQDSHQLIGIHHAGMSGSGANPGMNFGIPMHSIARFLLDHYPDIDLDQSFDDSQTPDEVCDYNPAERSNR